jgi:hypothetical protein
MGKDKFTSKAGNLRLQLNDKADIFHAEDLGILEGIQDYSDLIGIRNPALFRQNNFMGKAIINRMHKLNIEPKGTVINGFYEDTLPNDLPSKYTLKIYINYEAKE